MKPKNNIFTRKFDSYLSSSVYIEQHIMNKSKIKQESKIVINKKVQHDKLNF